MEASWKRRDLIGAGGAAMAAALAGPIRLPGSLEQVLPSPVRGLVPGDARELGDLIAQLLGLEEEAKALRLPDSPLAFGKGGIPLDPARLYELAMPRLVALVDRSERQKPGFADKAGALLARLHQSQYLAPEYWFGNGGQDPAPGLELPAVRRTPLVASSLDEEVQTDLPDPGDPGLVLPSGDLPKIATALPPINPSHQFDALSGEYAAWFAAAEIRPEHQDSANWHLTMMRQSRARYEGVGKQVGVPWQFIGAVHGLEASFNFRAHVHNGDYPLSQRTRQVPAGRPRTWLPPSSWEASALDALRLMGFAGQSDWSLPRMLYRLEAYNGFGYRHAKRPTPYLWSFSTLYDRGKFVANGRFDPKARSQQCGAAVMLKVLDLAGELD